jgi:hypothetical protein
MRHDVQDYTADGAKALILHNFYAEPLGRSETPGWLFALSDLYPHLDVDGLELSAPFSMDQISRALFSMDMNASHGPNGFVPSFYKQFWPSIKDGVNCQAALR